MGLTLRQILKEKREKQIEEITEIIKSYSNIEQSYYDGEWQPVNVYSGLAKTLYNKDFRIVNKDSVVLSREEYENIYEQAEANVLANIADGGTSCHWCMEKHQKIGYEKGSKETAEKCIRLIKETFFTKEALCEYIAKQFGVEIKE